MDLAKALPRARHGADTRKWATAQFLNIDTVTNRATVSLDGSPAVALPYNPSAVYTGVDTVFVLRDDGSGAGQYVMGPAASLAEPPPPPPPEPVAGAADPVTATALIRPSWSGTWSTKWGRYGAWNVGRYGGNSTLYQDEAYGSQPLVGIAVYGTQVRDLGALSIESIYVRLRRATGSGAVAIAGTPQGSANPGVPTPAGTPTDVDFGSTAQLLLPPSVAEQMRTGATRGLCTVGSAYTAVRGTSHPDGMALSVRYIRPA